MMEAEVGPALRRTFCDLAAASLATVGLDGAPHVAPVWFVWRDDAIYLSTRRGSRSWLNAEIDPRVSVVIDRGHEWSELSGVILEGRAELLSADHPSMRETMSAWHQKYRSLLAGDGFERFAEAIPELGFLRLVPARFDAWNHRTDRPA
jgi:nitroimidazol reductase NimA-like FMN-containing flavoprotein (pyridoxamine 5'-phosphate oxidase superfamily)